ncbi:hypothetical protein RHGRI_028595 [Rhododendron griersonianum]|uniref:DUF629 domain-containing protein n=1 Tax=Rhododendron griersonianum TaxID=479676 RepID=A0AAV6IIN5_9ERIC|nr:hypothetical protein RHGRI_028595 [Rhododendron griersonianum]
MIGNGDERRLDSVSPLTIGASGVATGNRIKAECEAAIEVHKKGDIVAAVALMNKKCLHYEICSLVHSYQCKMHHLEACRIGTSDGDLFLKHLRAAVESARRAVFLTPDPTLFEALYVYELGSWSSEVEDIDEFWKKNLIHRVVDPSHRKKNRKNVKKNYCYAITDEEKTGLIEHRIGDLKAYCTSLRKKKGEIGSAERVFSKAIGYAEKNKTWKFWPYYYCDEKFQDFKPCLKHIEQEHDGEIGQDLKMRPFLFTEIVAGGGESEVYDNLLANGAFYTADMGLILLSRRKLTSCPLDDSLLRVEVEYGSASSCSIRDAQVAVPPDIYALTKWLFDVPPTSPTAEELEEKWLELQNLMKCKGKEVPMRFEEAFVLIQSLRTEQTELIVQCKSLQVSRVVCAQELRKREQDGKHVRRSYKSLLTEMVRSHVDSAEEGSMFPTTKSLLAAAMGVRTEANKIRGLEMNRTEFEDQEDASIRMAIQNKMKQPLFELCINEAQITGIKGNCWRLLIRYKQSSLDYRGIMLDLMRNFIHAVTLPTAMKKKSRDDFDKILIEFEDDAEFKKFLKEFEKDDSKHVSIATISAILRKAFIKHREKLESQRQLKDEVKQTALAK